MIDGTRIIRTTVTRRSAPRTPCRWTSILTVGSVLSTKLANTTTMIDAAVVMTRAVPPMPMATARCGSRVLIQASWIRDSRKTS